MDINPLFFIISLVVLVYSAILHEIAHGYVANRLGDPTARLMGRLTLNPLPHIDPFLTIILPLILLFTSPIIFGGAKPVPVDTFNLRDGRKDMALVALAGPGTNILIAILAAIIAHLLGLRIEDFSNGDNLFSMFLGIVIGINISLAIFNLLPIPPLDGSKIFSLVLPDKEANAYLSLGSFGMIILFALLMFPLGPFSLLSIISAIRATFLTFLGF
jgi:Zn-dependent protease